MEEKFPRRIAWFAPWTWKPHHWLAAFIIIPPLYVLLVIVAEQSTKNQPNAGWLRSVVSILGAPLRPLRPHAQFNTLSFEELCPDCEVCGERAVVRFWEGVMVDDLQGVQCRRFCDRHHREYLDSPADALKPIIPFPPRSD